MATAKQSRKNKVGKQRQVYSVTESNIYQQVATDADNNLSLEQYNNNKEQNQLTSGQKNILKLGNFKSKTSNQANGLTYEGVSAVKTNNKRGKILKVEKQVCKEH